jgi:PPK2 family polyphosphate:nucleotide phosphotransferase
MSKAVDNPFLVPFDGSFRVGKAPTDPGKKAPETDECRDRLKERVEQLAEYQQVLYADDRHAVLVIFQAMDAAGKDGTIRVVTSGINPAGCQVFSFKVPSAEELDHDFLWRTARCLPERGRIGIFNRSYYEEVLAVRVHPEFLTNQRLPDPVDPKRLWEERFESIRDHEKHLAKNGMVIVKFWLNVSKAEQRRRFLSRIEVPEKNWKFAVGDVKERRYWDDYMKAYEAALNATSRPWAPWYAIPADDKPYAHLAVADILAEAFASLDLRYPEPGEAERAQFEEMLKLLKGEDKP